MSLNITNISVIIDDNLLQRHAGCLKSESCSVPPIKWQINPITRHGRMWPWTKLTVIYILKSGPIKMWLLPGRQSTQWACSNHVFSRAPAHVFEGHGQGALLIQQIVGHHQRERRWHPKVRQEAHSQGHHDADGNGPLRVLHLFPFTHTHIFAHLKNKHFKHNTWQQQYLLWRCSQSPQRRRSRWQRQLTCRWSHMAWNLQRHNRCSRWSTPTGF